MKTATLLLTCAFLCSSCFEEVPDLQAKMSDCTVLYYMAVDNSLSGEAQTKIDALLQAWTSTSGHLLVYLNTGAAQGSHLLEIKREAGANRVDTLLRYGQENAATPKVLGRTVNDASTRYPSNGFGLVMFSHSSGWLPAGTMATPRSIVSGGMEEMSLRDFASAIPDGQFRFILFESDLMASVEVAYELKSKTDYLLASASELRSPGFTPLYGAMLQDLYASKPQLETFARRYIDHCNTLPGDQCSATISVIKTSELAPLKPLLAKVEKRVEHWEWIDRSGWQHFDRRAADYLCYDLTSYVGTVGSAEEAAELDALLARAVTYQGATESFMSGSPDGFAINRHCGLTVYVPVAKYHTLNSERLLLRLYSQFTEE